MLLKIKILEIIDSSKPTNAALDALIGNIKLPKPEQINLPGVSMSKDNEEDMRDRRGDARGRRESFGNVDPEYDFKWFSGDLLIVVVIVFILYFIIFQRKKN